MRKYFVLGLLVLSASISLSCGQSGSTFTAGKIEGKVWNSVRGEPRPDVSVVLYKSTDVGDQGSKVDEVRTDGKGRYSFGAVNPGAYYMDLFWEIETPPCGRISSIFMTRDNWVASVGTLKSTGLPGLFVTGVGDQFKITAGDTFKKDIDLSPC